ncbi:hypothetical protein H3C66_03810 [Patescibacteria group bacterium]|nr:hypothetical protein [Patescibacteria group bacterium]
MPKATEVFQQLDDELRSREGEQYPLMDALALQMRLADHIQRLLDTSQEEITVPLAMLGEYRHSQRSRPHSSTGEVLFLERPDGQRVAIKLLLKLDPALNFQPNPDQTYAFEHPAVRLMTATGESLMGKVANKKATSQMYHGVAGLRSVGNEVVEVVQFSIDEVLDGKMEPVVIMRQMDASLADVLLDQVEPSPEAPPDLPPDEAQLARWAREVTQQILEASIALPEDIAAEIGSPKEVEELLTGKTIGWLTSRITEAEIVADPFLWKTVRSAQLVQSVFRQFFAMRETQEQLELRAKPLIGEGESSRLAQTFGPGDTKLGNVMLEYTDTGSPTAGLFDPQWLVLKPGAIGNEKAMFAPWPFADLMQIIAYTAAQPTAYGFPGLVEDIRTELQNYYGAEHWSRWHDLYFSMLTAYKLLVDVAYNIDPYLDKVKQGQPLPRQLRWILEAHPQKAVEVAEQAFARYHEEEGN